MEQQQAKINHLQPEIHLPTGASNISANSVTLNGTVDTKNYTTIVNFLYGTTATYGNQVSAAQSPIPGSLTDMDVSAILTGLQPNTTYHYSIEAINVNGTVYSPDATFKTYISSINLNTTFTFSDPIQQSSYRMIGLPGVNNLLISQVISGVQNTDWNAFYDNGNTQDYLEEFDGSTKFNFIPGRGFWILSKNPVSINRSVTPVTLSADNMYNIEIHYGWNIISNPYEKAISWQDIANQNGLNSNEIIYDWNGSSYTEPSTFEIYKGYYFNNIVASRSSLKIPYSFIGKISKDDLPKINTGTFIKLSLILNKQELSHIIAGINPLSKNEFDSFDYFAPPGDFSYVRIHIENNNLSLPYKQLSADFRPEINEGQIYNLRIKNNSKQNVNLIPYGLENFPGFEVYILDENLNRFYNLRYKNEINISPVHTNYDYKLLIGNHDFINNMKENYLPKGYLLYQNYPNPFNPSTIIKYQIPNDNSLVEIRIFNILGKEIKTLVNEIHNAGIYEVELNGADLSNGVYFYTMKAGSYSSTKKMIILK
ncbi:MAG: T9SS type A sorting domain-containing protein [Ignavibacteriaceae bacterium]